jgi:outer membrane receptor protein involved in Fe transport
MAPPVAAQDRRLDLDIPPQPLSSVIRALSERADIQLLYVEADVRGRRSAGLRGSFTVKQALARVLGASGLEYTFTESGAVAIRSAVVEDEGAGRGVRRHVAEDSGRALDLGTIVVSNVSHPLESLPASTLVVSGKDIIERSPLQQGVDVIRGLPGVQVSTLNQGGFRERFIIRGFASAGETIAAFLDGVPLNESNGHGDGSIDLSTMIPEEIDRVEMIKSPVSPLYGNFSRSGSINFITKNRVDETVARYTVGAWNTQRAAVAFGRTAPGRGQYYAVDFHHSDGFRENSETTRGNMAARWTWDLSPRSTLRVGGRSYAAKWDAPGYLSQAEWDAGQWQQSSTDLDGGEKERYDFTLNYNYALSASDSLGLTLFGYDTDFIRWRDAGGGQVEENNALTGVMAKILYRRQASLLSPQDELLLGFDALREDGRRRTWNNTTPWMRSVVTDDGGYYQHSWSVYGQLEMKPWPAVVAMAGFRYDHFDVALDREEIVAGAYTGASTRFDNEMRAFSPKLALSYEVSPALTLFGNAAKGFYLPSMFDKFVNDDLEAVSLYSYELGVRLKPRPDLIATLALFRIDAEDDVTRAGGPDGPLVNAGDVRRQGVEADMRLDLSAGLAFSASATYIDAGFRHYRSGGIDLSGNVPTEVPPYFYRLGLEYFSPASGIGARLTMNGKGEVWLSNENLFRYGSYSYLDAQLYLVRGPYTFDLKFGNLGDRRYAEYAFSGTDPGSQRYGPARPFNVSASLSARF